ncbi:(Fe-S)-binding protein [Candidatus Oscillochloris fontis]|uniref:(Fe-S)-binding protein n=1 Tax=Candidatus Oscillochloris fontis TaxID=2496868 RepID=UPI00101D791C|nr:(Fe-S)-binding protein [Candidatus Oscillochloris fontis]
MTKKPGRRVTLFVTCIVDQVYPGIGFATAKLLQAQGIEVHVPRGLTCCGQMAFNAGFRDEAYAVAARTIEVLRGQGDVVIPSGSCTAMIRHLYPELFQRSPYADPAADLIARTYEISEYLVDVLGVEDVGARFQGSLAYHDSCHGLRYLGLGRQARTLLGHVAQADVRPLPSHDQCCGFGGLFAVKQAAISEAMLKNKLTDIEATDPDLVVMGDASCMTQIGGGLSRQGRRTRARHLVEVLANMTNERP